MSRASIETTLHSLLPSHVSGPLPKQLVELTKSILVQSRTRASALKAEEEVARGYACANIACERLKRSLNLPKIVVKPPIQPKVYKKLYDHLNRLTTIITTSPAKKVNSTTTLAVAKPAQSKESKKRKREDDEDKGRDELDDGKASGGPKKKAPQAGKSKGRPTPDKKTSFAALGIGAGAKGSTATSQPSRAARVGVTISTRRSETLPTPIWTAGVIRALCTGVNNEYTISDVMAGMECVLDEQFRESEQDGHVGGEAAAAASAGSEFEAKNKGKDTAPQGAYPALIIALLSFVIQRGSDVEITPSALKKQRETMARHIMKLGNDKNLIARVAQTTSSMYWLKHRAFSVRRLPPQPGLEYYEKMPWVGWEEPKSNDVSRWLRWMDSHGIFEMDWAANVTANRSEDFYDVVSFARDAAEDHPMEAMSVSDVDDGDDEAQREKVDREIDYGLGTMRQPELDFTSADKMVSQKEWAKAMKRKIAELIAEGLVERKA